MFNTTILGACLILQAQCEYPGFWMNKSLQLSYISSALFVAIITEAPANHAAPSSWRNYISRPRHSALRYSFYVFMGFIDGLCIGHQQLDERLVKMKCF